jgi:hypothetical protein
VSLTRGDIKNLPARKQRPTCAILLLFALAVPSAALAENDALCAACHASESARHRATPMAQALDRVETCAILAGHPDLTFQDATYHYSIARRGQSSVLTVTDGSQTLSVPLLWAFGRGQAGQTYVFEYRGALFESRVSFYNGTGALDLTIGAAARKPQSLTEAAGRRMDDLGARDCFACHSHGAVAGGKLHLDAVAPGVGCGSCHGAVEKHAEAVRAGDAAGAQLPRLASLSAEETAELCGRCHRTWSQIALNGPRGVNNVRFQPYRLLNSKCYDASDHRIRCTACHDPHGVLDTNLAGYDAKCTACHSAAQHARLCPVAKANCAGCHMPKIELPGAHARFTDHQIRIVRGGDPYPN